MVRLEDLIPDANEREFYAKLESMAGKKMLAPKFTYWTMSDGCAVGPSFDFFYGKLDVSLNYCVRRATLYPSLEKLDASTPERLLQELDKAEKKLVKECEEAV